MFANFIYVCFALAGQTAYGIYVSVDRRGGFAYGPTGERSPVRAARGAERSYSVAAGVEPEDLMDEHDPPQPILQLKEKVKVYIMFAEGLENDRDIEMLREGIQMHPFVELVGQGPGDTQQQKDAAERADFILYTLYGDMMKEACSKSCPDLMRLKLVPEDKLAVLDLSDGASKMGWTPKAKIIFKRSLVSKTDGSFTGVSPGCGYDVAQPCFPLDYAIRPNDYLGLTSKSVPQERNLSVVFLTDPYLNLPEILVNQISAARLRVKHWLLEMKLPNTSFVGWSGRHEASFRHADIVVIVDPASYEGQHSLYEALGDGAVILANNRWIPMQFPFEGGKHIHYFDTCSTDDAKQKFQEKVKELLSLSLEEKNAFRLRGWKHGLRYHQAANRIDYMVKTMLDWRGQTPVIPKELRVTPDESSVAYMKEKCVDPQKELRKQGAWLTTYPWLVGKPERPQPHEPAGLIHVGGLKKLRPFWTENGPESDGGCMTSDDGLIHCPM